MSLSNRTLSRLALVAITVLISTLLVVPAQPAAASTSDLPFVMRFPQETDVTVMHDDFGAARSGGRRHTGNDLMAPKMTQVYAVGPGVVETVAYSSNAGRYVVIRHRNGWTTTYIHLNNDNPGTDDGVADWSLTVARRVKEGRRVKAGQLIGWVGDSGNAEWTGSHTHFEIAHDGVEQDPHPYLVEAYARDHEDYVRSLYLELYPGLRELIF